MKREALLGAMYASMLESMGPSHWWPGDTPFEIAVGAILTQNTNWANVEKAIDNLKRADALSALAIRDMPLPELAELIRPSGYFRMKAQRLKDFTAFLDAECGLDIEALMDADPDATRESLLAVRGIGPETADSILLYALGMPTFVVDSYTRRILSRHALIPEDAPYDEMRDFFMDVLEPDASMFNEFHALLVRVAKDWCRKGEPLCDKCPLAPYLP
ncbi:endonuclease-3 related protein [Desulfobaculum xiamenense]|uniref:Endonuclease-3 related protein n=1 Tax=Desulfobaculum xiamenense TaxID=995050 RepID=A0A846QJ84_9BACT|nr:endonuclease III domain-containing protein [Desulfobaculum xiamenense]NJB67130.1 endonuclease-3 related protein [Desulfobaculum xiamenense]